MGAMSASGAVQVQCGFAPNGASGKCRRALPSAEIVAPLAGREIAELDSAERDALQASHFVSGGLQHPADFAVPAFGQLHNQVRLTLRPLQDVDRRGLERFAAIVQRPSSSDLRRRVGQLAAHGDDVAARRFRLRDRSASRQAACRWSSAADPLRRDRGGRPARRARRDPKSGRTPLRALRDRCAS